MNRDTIETYLAWMLAKLVHVIAIIILCLILFWPYATFIDVILLTLMGAK